MSVSTIDTSAFSSKIINSMTFNNTNNNIFAVSGTVVPEPSIALLGGLGFLCLLRRRR
jgi:hypothetical protein